MYIFIKDILHQNWTGLIPVVKQFVYISIPSSGNYDVLD